MKNNFLVLLAASLGTVFSGTAAPSQVAELSQIGTTLPGFVIEGINSDDTLGYVVSAAGDINGDGLTDFAIGAPAAAPGGKTEAGQSFVVFGKSDNSPVQLSDPGGFNGFRIDGANAGDRAGTSVHAGGDVNGDGLADIIIGAPFADPNGIDSAGASYVVFGKSDFDPVDLANIGMGGFVINGIDEDDLSGLSVAGGGDVNGDGVSDLVVGANSADPGGRAEAGEAYVIFGKSDSNPVNLSSLGSGGFRIDGVDAGDILGDAVAIARDVNGDGLSDVVVGAVLAAPGGNANAGETYVVFGKADTNPVSLASLGAGGFRINGIDVDDYSGGRSLGTGDINADGLTDIIIGATGGDPGSTTTAGESYVVFGKAGTDTVELGALGAGGFQVNGISDLDYSGESVSGISDVNGDGLADLIIGAPLSDPNGDSSGQSYVVFGKGDSTTVDLASLGTGGFKIAGAAVQDLSGKSVSGGGDANGDGIMDMIVGAPGAQSSGRAYVIFGPGPGVTFPVTTSETGQLPSGPIPVPNPGTSPAPTRCWYGFDGGSAGTVTGWIQRSRSGLPAQFTSANSADVVWWFTSTRTGWTQGTVILRYTDEEITGLNEANLILCVATSIGGPYTTITSTLNPANNTITATIDGEYYFILVDGSTAVNSWQAY